jgi:hypothetical protein
MPSVSSSGRGDKGLTPSDLPHGIQLDSQRGRFLRLEAIAPQGRSGRDSIPAQDCLAKQYSDFGLLLCISPAAEKTNTEEAMLTGLLHVLGKLYIVMRARELNVDSDEDVTAIFSDWHAAIAQAIAENWGLPEPLQQALAQQDELESSCKGAVCQTDILQAARIMTAAKAVDRELTQFPVMQRLNLDADALDEFTAKNSEELRRVRSSLAG